MNLESIMGWKHKLWRVCVWRKCCWITPVLVFVLVNRRTGAHHAELAACRLPSSESACRSVCEVMSGMTSGVCVESDLSSMLQRSSAPSHHHPNHHGYGGQGQVSPLFESRSGPEGPQWTETFTGWSDRRAFSFEMLTMRVFAGSEFGAGQWRGENVIFSDFSSCLMNYWRNSERISTAACHSAFWSQWFSFWGVTKTSLGGFPVQEKNLDMCDLRGNL